MKTDINDLDDSFLFDDITELVLDVHQINHDIDNLFGVDEKINWAELQFVTMFSEKDERRELIRALLHDKKAQLKELPFLWNICRILVTSIDVVNSDSADLIDSDIFPEVDSNLISFFEEFVELWTMAVFEPIKDQILKQYWNPTDESCKTEFGSFVLLHCKTKEELDTLLDKFHEELYDCKLNYCLLSFAEKYKNCQLSSIDPSTAEIHDNAEISFSGVDDETKERIFIKL